MTKRPSLYCTESLRSDWDDDDGWVFGDNKATDYKSLAKRVCYIAPLQYEEKEIPAMEDSLINSSLSSNGLARRCNTMGLTTIREVFHNTMFSSTKVMDDWKALKPVGQVEEKDIILRDADRAKLLDFVLMDMLYYEKTWDVSIHAIMIMDSYFVKKEKLPIPVFQLVAIASMNIAIKLLAVDQFPSFTDMVDEYMPVVPKEASEFYKCEGCSGSYLLSVAEKDIMKELKYHLSFNTTLEVIRAIHLVYPMPITVDNKKTQKPIEMAERLCILSYFSWPLQKLSTLSVAISIGLTVSNIYGFKGHGKDLEKIANAMKITENDISEACAAISILFGGNNFKELDTFKVLFPKYRKDFCSRKRIRSLVQKLTRINCKDDTSSRLPLK